MLEQQICKTCQFLIKIIWLDQQKEGFFFKKGLAPFICYVFGAHVSCRWQTHEQEMDMLELMTEDISTSGNTLANFNIIDQQDVPLTNMLFSILEIITSILTRKNTLS